MEIKTFALTLIGVCLLSLLIYIWIELGNRYDKEKSYNQMKGGADNGNTN